MARTGLAVSRFALLCVSALLFLILRVGAETVQGLRVQGTQYAAQLHALRVQWHDPRPFDRDNLSKSALDEIVTSAEGVSDYFGVATTTVKATTDGWAGENVRLGAVSGEMFATLGVTAALGRLEIGTRRAVISHHLWKQAFAGAPDVIGRHIVLFGHSMAKDPRTIVEVAGVAAKGFRGLQPNIAPQDIWLDWSGWRDLLLPGLSDMDDANAADLTEMDAVLRLKEGRTASSVSEELTARATAAGRIADSDAKLVVEPGIAIGHGQRNQYRQRSAVYRLISVLLLLTSAATVVAIQALQHARVQHADLIRAALGESSRRRSIREGLEAAAIVSPPILAATILAALGARLMPAMDSVVPMPALDFKFVLNSVVIPAGTLWLAVLSLILIVKPMFRSLLPRVATLHARGMRQRVLLLPAGIAAFAIMTIIAGAVASLLVLDKLRSRNFGFSSDKLSMIQIKPAPAAEESIERYFWRQTSRRPLVSLLSRLDEALPRRYAIASASPFDAPLVRRVRLDGVSDDEVPRFVFVNEVSQHYFHVVGVRLLAGNAFSGSGGASEVIVSEKFARRYLGDPAPIGRKFALQGQIAGASYETVTIVGVVPDFHRDSPRGEPTAMIYRPLSHEGGFWVGLSQHEDTFVLHAAISEYLIDAGSGSWMADQPIRFGWRIDQAYRPERLEAILLTIAAIGLAGLGIVALISMLRTLVSERASEFAIRRVLGASSRQLAAATIRVAPVIVAPAVLLAMLGVHRTILHVVPASDDGVSLAATSIATVCMLACWSLAVLATVNSTLEKRLLDSLKSDSL